MRAQCAARSATRAVICLCNSSTLALFDEATVDEDAADEEDDAGMRMDAGAGVAASSALPKKAALVRGTE